MNGPKHLWGAQRSGQEWLTAITAALFLVIASTGIMLLVGVGKGAVKGAHEWLGLAFAVGAAAHGVYHWRSIVGYARRPALWVVSVAVLLATAVFVVPSQSVHGTNPVRAITELVCQAPLDHVASLIDVDVRELEARLHAAGVQFVGVDQSLAEIERSSGRHMPELLAIITQK